MNKKYFNNAGAGLMSEKTLNTIIDHMRTEMDVGAYKAAILHSDKVTDFYTSAAKLLNAASKDEIAYIDSASRGWNLVMYGMNLTSNDTIVTLESEYGTNLLTIYDISQSTHCSVRVVKCEENGALNLLAVEEALAEGATVLAVSHVAAQGSIVNPVIELGKLARKYGVAYIVDGCQAVGQIKVDVQEIGCNAYITAGRKWLRGPRGTGILYVKGGQDIRTPQIDLASADLVFDTEENVVGVKIRDDAKQFELWEKNVAALLGLANAVEECMEYGIDKISKLIISKTNCIRKCINNNRNLVLVGDSEAETGVASFYMRETHKEKYVKELIEKEGFIISYICDWDCPLFFPKNGVQYIFRISPHYYTDETDIQSICELIKRF